ncbi:MAG: hypothetical protein QM737_05475 [Ferruginibacter sp.]
MDSLISSGQQLLAKTKNNFIKLKYGYQLVRLAHYSKRYDDAIKWYDTYIAGNKTQTVLQSMCMALKAGALYRLGERKEAALLFSKAFSANVIKRVSNYLGFVWSTRGEDTREMYLSYCKTNEEKVAMLILFALSGSANELATLKEIYKLDPGNIALEVLVVREIKKLEETYLTPILNNKKGGPESMFYGYAQADTTGEKVQAITDLSDFLNMAAQKNNVSNPALFETAAAYTCIMKQDYKQARSFLESAATMKLTGKVKDQWELANILLTINSKESIDAGFEQALLPSIKWLQQQAKTDSIAKPDDYWEISPWRDFYRNVMSQVIAKKYHEQHDFCKELLAIGASEMIYENSQRSEYSGSMVFLHNFLESKDVKKLYDLFNSNNRTDYENYLVSFSNITKNDVTEFLGTVYLREYNYGEAIEWFKKTNATGYQIDTDPFLDILYDKVWPNDGEIFSTTKLAFATEMQRLEKLSVKDKKNAAKYYYKMALGCYNMTYYGRAWSLVQYDRSGNDNYSLEDDKRSAEFRNTTGFKKEYYGCFKAHDYFKKAMDASKDKNFKARCLFMMAKCFQKTVADDENAFMNSKYFPTLLKEYGNTASYKEAFNSCSYLRDFVKKK